MDNLSMLPKMKEKLRKGMMKGTKKKQPILDA